MAKSTKKFFITQTSRCYDGSVRYTPKCYKRFETMEEAEAAAAKLNEQSSKERSEAIYKSWVADPECEWATEEWYEKKINGRDPFYHTYEAKESK